jgi:NAD(P)-dependent dehydrogenase (short-subunit alcohol dehydrogenase family)
VANARTLEGRTCVVTGATSGIGKEVARGLARLGARVVVVGRSREKGEATVAEIRGETGNAGVSLALADLASLAEVRRLAAELLGAHPAIHVLVNNAGIVMTRRTLTPDGIETVFGVNHLAPFLLTNLLLDRLRASAPARIVNVASDAHRFAKLDWDDLQGETGWSFARRYGLSKLANILFTAELARRLEGSGVVASCLHPGGVATGLGTNNGWFARLVMTLGRPLLLTPAQGADTALWLASAPEAADAAGRYYVKRKVRAPSRLASDRAAQTRLWDLSARMAGLEAGRVP